LSAPKETVQLTLSLYLLGMAGSQVIAGPMADRFGRRPIILIALVIFIIASFAASQVHSIEMLILARVVQAFGATSCLSLSRTIIADVSNRETTMRIIASITMVMVLAPMASPNIGSFLDTRFGWPSIFLFCAVFGVITIAIMAAWLPETRPAKLQNATFSAVTLRTLALARNPAFLRQAGIASFASAAFFIILGATPHVIINAMQRTPAEFSLWFILLGVGYALGNFTVTRNGHRMARIMWIGNFMLLAGAAIMAGLALVPVMHPAAVFAPAVLVTYGNGLVLPNAMASGIQTDREAAGAASGLMGFAQMSLGAIFSYLAGLAPNGTPLAMSLMILGCGLLAVVLTMRR
ncbi:MAG: multidrug effflux MFS transporter, partial [Proteobacteria bacterium]|nr:multidrug effflux MFS transporter [Pseudomonadota bacterium]